MKETKLNGTYTIRLTKVGNIVLSNQQHRMTIRPELLKEILKWLHDNNLYS